MIPYIEQTVLCLIAIVRLSLHTKSFCGSLLKHCFNLGCSLAGKVANDSLDYRHLIQEPSLVGRDMSLITGRGLQN